MCPVNQVEVNRPRLEPQSGSLGGGGDVVQTFVRMLSNDSGDGSA